MVKIAKPSETWGSKKGSYCKRKKPFFTSMRVERKIAPWLFSRRLDHTKELHETDTSSHLPYKKEIIHARILFQVLVNNLCGFADRFSGNSVKRALPYSAWQTRVLKSIANLEATHIFHVHAVHSVTALGNICLSNC